MKTLKIKQNNMKANELRIGNYVSYIGNETRVTVISDGFVSTLKSAPLTCNQVDPIPLTREWLLKLGFDKMSLTKWSGNGYDYQPKEDESVRMDYVHKDRYNYVFISHEVNTYKGNVDDYGFFMHVNEWYERCTEGKIYTQLKHVHQLQNLYFALTGEELEII